MWRKARVERPLAAPALWLFEPGRFAFRQAPKCLELEEPQGLGDPWPPVVSPALQNAGAAAT